MPSISRKRRIVQDDDDQSEEERTQNTQRNQRPPPDSNDESEDTAEDEAGGEEMDVDADPDNQKQVVKKLVRYALACEYKRISIKRAGISEKVIGKQRGDFKRVFEAAQNQLRTKFGMEMVELPAREKVTMKDKRAAQKTKSNSKPVVSYIVKTILPLEYRIPEIIPPSIIGSADEEAAYTGLCTVLVSIISLSPDGSVPDHKLMRYLHRLNADKNACGEPTSIILQRMIKQGYLVKITDKSADGEEAIDWRVGPRSKVEIGNSGIQGMVKEVYGGSAPEDLDKRLHRSLGMEMEKSRKGKEENEQSGEDNQTNESPGPSTRSSGRRRVAVDDD